MNHHGSPTLNQSVLSQVRSTNYRIAPRPADFVADIQGSARVSRPAGSVVLDFGCDRHDGRLMRLWMLARSGSTTFGGEGCEGAWDTDSSGQGAVVVTCVRNGCNNSSRLTNEWLVAQFGQVRASFESGKGLPIAWFALSQVKA